MQPITDFFEMMHVAYLGWLTDGKVTINSTRVELAVDEPPAELAEDAIYRFTQFIRAYLRANPVVGTGLAPAHPSLGLLLRDRQHPVLVRPAPPPSPAQEAWGITGGRDLSANELLPVSGALPISKGG